MFEKILSWLFPDHCVICRESLDLRDVPYLCQNHFSLLPLNVGPRCPCCQLPFALSEKENCPDCSQIDWEFKKVVSLFLYEEPLSQILTQFKYDKRRFLIRTFEALLDQHLIQIKKECEKLDLILPVPLAPVKEKERGFNQSGLFAEILAKRVGLPFLSQVLQRQSGLKQASKAQAKLTRKERIKNLENQFVLGRQAQHVLNKRVLLVDDVLTTGSTANECAKVLKDKGAEEVVVFVLARTQIKE